MDSRNDTDVYFRKRRRDIFALDDRASSKAWQNYIIWILSDKKALKGKRWSTLSKNWSPYRTYACSYLWGWKDNAPKI